ncbi:copper resistance CopC/CopD family protein [Streptomyces flavalbus]|uniref:Copper resistance CopC/CopD family protein n=1 Tax=Streptomyces flavalbus TaxID=2665155 RepID=A0ABW2WE53_9ACTN
MLLGAVLVLLLLGGAAPVWAHAALRDSGPRDGTVLTSAPRHLDLSFTESVGLLDGSVRMLDPDGRRVHLPEARHGPGGAHTVRVALPDGLGHGTYTVAWRVVSADSHPVSGAFTFSVGERTPAVAAPDTGPTEDPATKSLHNIARYLAYLAVALLIGTAVFAAVCRPPDPAPLRTHLRVAWWTLLTATLALLVLRAPYEAGTGPATALDASALPHTLTSRPGLALLARLALLAPAAYVAARVLRGSRSRVTYGTGAAVAVALALTWAAAEHASAGIQVPVAVTSHALHLLAASVWLGGLAALYRTEVPAPAVARFSRLAFTCVTVLVVTGTYQAWRGLGPLDALTTTSYGRLLLAKLGAVAALLTAATLSRRWTRRLRRGTEAAAPPRERVSVGVAAGAGPVAMVGQLPVAQGSGPVAMAGELPAAQGSGPPATKPLALRRSVLTEAVIGVVVLVLTTVLTSTLPGRAATGAAAAGPAARGPAAPAGQPRSAVTTVPFDLGATGGRGTVQISLDPARVGENSVQAVVFSADGGLSTVPELRLSFTLPAQDIGPLTADLTDRGGYWATDSLDLPVAGDWTMKVTVRTTDVDQVTESARLRVWG